MLRKIVVSLPPMIAAQGLTLDPDLVTELESAMREISRLDATHGPDLEAVGVLLLRTESVASSKIEAVVPAGASTGASKTSPSAMSSSRKPRSAFAACSKPRAMSSCVAMARAASPMRTMRSAP